MGPAVSAQTEASSLLEGGSTPSRDAAQKEDQMPTGVQDAVLAEKASDMQDEKSAGGLTAPTRGAWIRFSVAFGLIHGCAVCAMTYASTFIGPELASKTLSVFYATYTVSTLAIAEGFATAVGTPAAMLTGFVAYMTLLGAYGAYGALGDSPYETLGAAIVTAASVVGGVGGAFIWIAQTMLYGAAAGTELKNEFATIFATLYVSLEAFAKIAVALGLWAGWRETEAITLLVVASALTWGAVVVAPELFGLTFGVTTRRTTTPGRRRSDERRYDYYGSSKKVPSALSRTEKQKMPHAAQQASATSVMVRSVARVARAHVAERRIVTLAPLPLAFGFAEGFYTEWMTSHVAAARRLGRRRREQRDDGGRGGRGARAGRLDGALRPALRRRRGRRDVRGDGRFAVGCPVGRRSRALGLPRAGLRARGRQSRGLRELDQVRLRRHVPPRQPAPLGRLRRDLLPLGPLERRRLRAGRCHGSRASRHRLRAPGGLHRRRLLGDCPRLRR